MSLFQFRLLSACEFMCCLDPIFVWLPH